MSGAKKAIAKNLASFRGRIYKATCSAGGFFTGEQLAEAIRLDNDSVPIYLISGYSEAELQNRLKDKGITAFLPKPISMEKLATALSRHLPISHRK